MLGDLDLPVGVPEAATVIAGYRVAMFPFVRGRRATGADAPALARAMRLMHDHQLVDLPRLPIEESWCVETMRGLLDHPWITDRRPEVEAQLDRLEGATERARATPRPDVICHTDFGGHNALVDDGTGAVVAILDWVRASRDRLANQFGAALSFLGLLRKQKELGVNSGERPSGRIAGIKNHLLSIAHAIGITGVSGGEQCPGEGHGTPCDHPDRFIVLEHAPHGRGGI